MIWYLILLSFINIGFSYEFYDEFYYDYGNDIAKGNREGRLPPLGIPNFTSPSLDITANIGNTVRLPCKVDKLQGFVLVWKRGEEIISLGDTVISNAESRYMVEEEDNGSSLVIRDVGPKDIGEYVCQVSAYKPTYMKHRVFVRTEPVITTRPIKEAVLQAGERLDLECLIVGGTPKPRLSWRKVGHSKPASQQGSGEFHIDQVRKQDAGQYICEADNGFSRHPVSSVVSVQVQYAPEVSVTELVHVENAAELLCSVDAHPTAKVNWIYNMNTEEMKNINAHQTHLHNRMRYSILLESSEVGNYTCVATNSVGTTQKLISIQAARIDATTPAAPPRREVDRQSRRVTSTFIPDPEKQQREYFGSGSASVSQPFLVLILTLGLWAT